MSFGGKCPVCKELVAIEAEPVKTNQFICPKCSHILKFCQNPIVECNNFTVGNYCTSCKVKAVGLAITAFTGIGFGT